MANLTVRDIPDDVLEKLRLLSKTERRSLNSELLHVLEAGLGYVVNRRDTSEIDVVSRETQLLIWGELSGQWQDDVPFEETVSTIYEGRTEGREVSL